MHRFDRLQAILIQLQSKRIVKAQELADRFEISLRTVYRDIRSLEEAGVPIGAEAGVGYYLMDHYQLPPVTFTSDEATALLIGEKLMGQMCDSKVRAHFCSALFKIKAILKPSEREKLDSLNDRIAVYNNLYTPSSEKQLYLNEIQQALVQKQVLEITYQAKFADEQLLRAVEPVGLCNYSSQWHLIAWCRLRNALRDFRLDRIQALRVTEQSFTGKSLPNIDEYMKMLALNPGNANISLRVPLVYKNRINESKYWYGFISEEIFENECQMHFANEELTGFAIWLLNSGCMATIEKPIALSVKLSEIVSVTYKHYSQGDLPASRTVLINS
jgi:predicted DNA-binding transcriptional regulator YafY